MRGVSDIAIPLEIRGDAIYLRMFQRETVVRDLEAQPSPWLLALLCISLSEDFRFAILAGIDCIQPAPLVS